MSKSDFDLKVISLLYRILIQYTENIRNIPKIANTKITNAINSKYMLPIYSSSISPFPFHNNKMEEK